MLQAIEHAKMYTNINQRKVGIFLHAQRSLLFSKDKPLEKIINKSLFDIAMESCDNAKIGEFLDLYILSILNKEHGVKNVDLFA